jgi:CubicO group peptidase (beta-lactamase class C family)
MRGIRPSPKGLFPASTQSGCGSARLGVVQTTFRVRGWVTLVLALTAGLSGSARQQQSAVTTTVTTSPFESYVELLRQQAGIPGISATILKDGQVVWERGFGFANVESRIGATPDTPYLIGDLSETFATVLLLQCVEQRHLELDDPLTRYKVDFGDQNPTLRQVLSHSSTAPNGPPFKYDPGRFSQLSGAVEFCAPQPYRKTVSHRLLERLAMRDSVPGRDLKDPEAVPEGLFDAAILERYARVLSRLAVPYKLDKKGKPTRSDAALPESLTASDGIISTVRDLARLDAAIDDQILLLPETLSVAWSNAAGRDGTALPTGLGWFVQSYHGEPVVWQFGLTPGAYSALAIKLPLRQLTLIMLANSDALCPPAPNQLANGDVTRSVFATVFLRLFVP